MALVPVLVQCSLCLILVGLLLQTPLAASTTFPTTLPGCPDKCGNVAIPYPFGTRTGCFRDGFGITCNESFTPPKPFLLDTNIDLLDINITTAEARFLNYIGYRCYNKTSKVNGTWPSIGFKDQQSNTFLFSNKRNKFTVIGCFVLAYITGNSDNPYQSGCASFCDSLNSTTGFEGSCNGIGCCQTTIPAGLNYYEVQWGFDKNKAWSFNPCTYAALMQEDWYNFTVNDLKEFRLFERAKENAPIVLDWAIRGNGTCLESHTEDSSNPACQSKHSGCYNTTNGEGYICRCSEGYKGNPYLPDGCVDIDECQSPKLFSCAGTCSNTDGSYECACPKGTSGDGKAGNCTKIPEKFPRPARLAICSILGVAILLGLLFLATAYQHHKRHIKVKEEYERYYQMMDNHLRVFSEKQIQTACDNFSEARVLGAGSQGKVYKGLLQSNQVVAIKKAKEFEETQKEEFVNEILLLSQINHKNIVKLLGCCLEVKIPMLVYEFVPNGTLFELLHGKNKPKPISLGTRLKIALDSAEALDYLHSSISRPILHGDVKSANILLDDNYQAKVSDFGASNLVSIDDTQVVKVVQGTRGYLDPEYVATAVLTKKSDVYSFGVVLLELITRKYAIFTDETNEKKHLASCFVSSVQKNKLHEFIDKNIIVGTDEKVAEVLQEVSELAVRCLSVRGEDRPAMRQVVDKLQHVVKKINSNLLGPDTVHEETESLLSESTYNTTQDASAFHCSGYSSVLDIETRVPR